MTINGKPSQWKQVMQAMSPRIDPWATSLFFVNDLPKAVSHCAVNLYAEDTAVYTCDVNLRIYGEQQIWGALLAG